MLHRGVYITCYFLYLVFLLIALWFLLAYSGVPSWVYIFFVIAVACMIICMLIREFGLQHIETTPNVFQLTKDSSGWAWAYGILHIVALIVGFIGFLFVIIYSSIPWWVWLILGFAALSFMVASTIATYKPHLHVLSVFFSVTGLVLYVVSLAYIIIYAHAPWWVWLILGFAAFFAIAANVSEPLSDKNLCLDNISESPCKSSSRTKNCPNNATQSPCAQRPNRSNKNITKNSSVDVTIDTTKASVVESPTAKKELVLPGLDV